MGVDRTILWRLLGLLAVIVAACSSPPASSAPASPTGLAKDEVAALNSLAMVDGYPLYTMEEHASHEATAGPETPPIATGNWNMSWACSLFAALADPEHRLYGRNFDWDYSPALLLSYFPDDGYASISMVDIAFLGYTDGSVRGLDTAPLADRRRLLDARFLPFDGMNEKGLVVAMAAVPTAIKTDDPAKPSIGEIRVIREMLDHAASVDEAVALLRRYNVDMAGGPPIHYLIADASGKAALLEFSRGELVVRPNEKPWHLATNFIVAEAGSEPERSCPRYEKLSKALAGTGGSLTRQAAFDLLSTVTQTSTQWSAVYDISTGDVLIAMGREYDSVHTFHIPTKR